MVLEAALQHLRAPRIYSVALELGSGSAPFDSKIVGGSAARAMNVCSDLGFEAGEVA